MPQQDKSFQVSGDGIYSGFSAAVNSACRSSKKLMTYDWTILQTLIFIITPFFVMLAISSEDEDDDGSDGGMLTPVYAPSPS